jgi:hypothetical protein
MRYTGREAVPQGCLVAHMDFEPVTGHFRKRLYDGGCHFLDGVSKWSPTSTSSLLSSKPVSDFP